MKTRSLTNARGNAVKEVVIFELSNHNEIMTHYGTPVAGFVSGEGYIRTDVFHSTTTSKHINQYVGGKGQGEEVSQERLDEMLDGL